MTIEFTREGLTVDTFDEIHTELKDGYREIYGEDLDLSQNTPDGQRIGLSAKMELDLQSFLAQLYNNLDPDVATGSLQDIILKYTGTTKSPASKSSAVVTISTDRTLTLPAGYTVKDTASQEWITEQESALSIGDTDIQFVASKYGAVSALQNTITEPVTIVLGVISINNADAAIVGRNEETEEEVRIRRNKSLGNPSYSQVGSVTAKLYEITGVLDAVVYENDTDIYDSVRDIDAHTIWIICDGGSNSQIAESVTKQKTGGTGLKGSEVSTFIELLVRPDGTEQIYTHIVNFDRPTDVVLYVRASARRRVTGQPVDTDLIASKISERTFRIAELLQAAELYADGYQAGTNFVLYDMEVSTDGVLWTDEEVDPGFGGRFTLDVGNITITEVL